MAKLKKITKEDIAIYRIPGGLKYSPTGEYLAFQVKRADLEKNEYHSDVWLARGGEASGGGVGEEEEVGGVYDDDALAQRLEGRLEEAHLVDEGTELLPACLGLEVVDSLGQFVEELSHGSLQNARMRTRGRISKRRVRFRCGKRGITLCPSSAGHTTTVGLMPFLASVSSEEKSVQ